MSNSINHTQAANLIKTCGTDVTYLLRGQPGVGKSAVLKTLARELPDYLPCYVDVANLDLGDIGMPVIDRDRMVTHYAPNARFGVHPGQTRPVLLMLDELTKASKAVMNMLLPVGLERRIGDVALPAGSIVFATGNLSSDGVGDNLPPHAENRMTTLDFANPTADEWVMWGSANGVTEEVLAFAKQYPAVFSRYDQLEPGEQNPYIFNPMAGQVRSYCSPRSLAKASHQITSRHALGDALLPALIGTVGESAARDMEAMIALGDQTPSFEAIVQAPATTKLPDGMGGYFLLVFRLAGRAKSESIDAIMTYVNRWNSFEAKTLFISQLAGNPAKVGMACKCRAFTQAAAAVGKFF